MSNIIIENDTTRLINLLQARLNEADSVLTSLKANQSLHDIAKISIETKDDIYTVEHVTIVAYTIILIFFVGYMAHKFTFNPKWTKENPNPYADETLAMPKGTMRAVITFTLLFFTVLIEMHVVRNPLIEMWTDKYITSFQMVLAFYFGSQVMTGLSTQEVQKAQVLKGQVPTDPTVSPNSSTGSEAAKMAPTEENTNDVQTTTTTVTETSSQSSTLDESQDSK